MLNCTKICYKLLAFVPFVTHPDHNKMPHSGLWIINCKKRNCREKKKFTKDYWTSKHLLRRLRTKSGNLWQKGDMHILARQKLQLYQQKDTARQLALKHQGYFKARCLLIVKPPRHLIKQEGWEKGTAGMRCFKLHILKNAYWMQALFPNIISKLLH